MAKEQRNRLIEASSNHLRQAENENQMHIDLVNKIVIFHQPVPRVTDLLSKAQGEIIRLGGKMHIIEYPGQAETYFNLIKTCIIKKIGHN